MSPRSPFWGEGEGQKVKVTRQKNKSVSIFRRYAISTLAAYISFSYILGFLHEFDMKQNDPLFNTCFLAPRESAPKRHLDRFSLYNLEQVLPTGTDLHHCYLLLCFFFFFQRHEVNIKGSQHEYRKPIYFGGQKVKVTRHKNKCVGLQMELNIDACCVH